MERKLQRPLYFGAGLMKIYAYIDGFNLYYRALKGTKHKWLNLDLLAKQLLLPGQSLEKIRYFTAHVSPRAGDLGAPARQRIFFTALQTLPNIEFHYGSFLAKSKKRPLKSNPQKFVEILDTEEKGSDVNLAVHLVNDGWHGRYDIALLFSQDTDLIEPIKIVTQELNLKIGLVWLDQRRPNQHMQQFATFTRHIRDSHLVASQFSNPLFKPDGGIIRKPDRW